MAEVIVVGDEDEGIVDARTLWRPKYVAEKQARETVEAQTTQLLIQNDQLRTEVAIEKRARETAEAQTTQLLTQIVQLRTEAALEKRARETAEAHTTKLQTQIVQLRTEAAREKRARETAEAQTTQLHISNDQLRTEAAREKRARETAEAQLQKLSNELESTKATVRELQSAIDALREELTLAATAQGKQEKKGTAMAQRERLGPEVAIAAGTSTQLQKERAVMMEVQAQVTAIDAVEAFTQASLDPSREERCTLQYLYQNLGEHRDRATEGSSNNAASNTSLLPGCQWVSPATSPRQKDDGLGLGENLPATAMSPTLAISAQSAPGARAFKVGGPGNVVAVSQSQEATTIEPLHFDVPYMFQRGKLGKSDEGKKFSPQH